MIADGTASAGSSTLTSASGGFAGAVAGMVIMVNRAAASGVNAHITTIASVTSNNVITLTAPAVTAVTNTPVFFGTDDTTACNAAITAAEAYLAAGHSYVEIYTPGFCALAGTLRNNKSGNGYLVFAPLPVTGVKKHIVFSGPSWGSLPYVTGSRPFRRWAAAAISPSACSPPPAAQITNINADGNPAIICGPNEGFGYGVNAVYSNHILVVKNLTLLNAHSDNGLTYGAINAWGCANAQIENVSVGTAGVVTRCRLRFPRRAGHGPVRRRHAARAGQQRPDLSSRTCPSRAATPTRSS